MHPDDIPRLAQLGVIASMQPIHATADIDIADLHWGKRAATGYAWRSLLDAGARLAFGSDAPVEDISPLLGIHAAVTRRRADGYPGPEGWYPEQRLTVSGGRARLHDGRGLCQRRGSAQRLAHARQAGRPGRPGPRHLCDRSDGHPQDRGLATMVGGAWVYRNDDL